MNTYINKLCIIHTKGYYTTMKMYEIHKKGDESHAYDIERRKP